MSCLLKLYMIFLFIFLSNLVFAENGDAGVESVLFDTSCRMPVFKADKSFKGILKLLNTKSLPEGPLVSATIVMFSKQFALSDDKAQKLIKLFTEVYAEISKDPECKYLPSAIQQTISTDPARKGHYYLYRPVSLNKENKTIVFLHGFGGNFQFYVWALKKAFPDYVILVPSWGISWRYGKAVYLDEMIRDAEKRLDVKLALPWLFAISAGGPAGFNIYNKTPAKFKGYICLASSPSLKQIPKLRSDLNVLMLNGSEDMRFPVQKIRDKTSALRRRLKKLQFSEINADHFFLLTNHEETFRIIKAFMKSE